MCTFDYYCFIQQSVLFFIFFPPANLLSLFHPGAHSGPDWKHSVRSLRSEGQLYDGRVWTEEQRATQGELSTWLTVRAWQQYRQHFEFVSLTPSKTYDYQLLKASLVTPHHAICLMQFSVSVFVCLVLSLMTLNCSECIHPLPNYPHDF